MVMKSSFYNMFSAIMALKNKNPKERFMSVWSLLLAVAQVFVFLSGLTKGTVKSWAALLELTSIGSWAYYSIKNKQTLTAGQVMWLLVVGVFHGVAETHEISVEILLLLLVRRKEIPGKRRFFLFGRKQRSPQVSLSTFLQGHIWWKSAFHSVLLTTIITLLATQLSSETFSRLHGFIFATSDTTLRNTAVSEPLSQIQEEGEEDQNDEVQREKEVQSPELVATEYRDQETTFSSEADGHGDDAEVIEQHALQQEIKYTVEEEEEEPEDTSACYLVYEADSSGRLVEIYSKTPIENAIGMWIPGPGHSLPDFKFTQGQNGNGRNVLIGNCAAGTVGRKNYASGWCSFIRSAQLKNGIVTLVDPMEGHKGLLVDVYVYNSPNEKDETVLLQAFRPAPVGNALAVACMPRNSRFLFLGISGIPLNKWLEDGRKHGTSTKLRGNDNTTVSLIAESPALTRRRTVSTPGPDNKVYTPSFKENYLHTPAKAFDDPTPVKPTPLEEVFEEHARTTQERTPFREFSNTVIEGQ